MAYSLPAPPESAPDKDDRAPMLAEPMLGYPTLDDAAHVLRQVFGFPAFRGEQEAVVRHVVAELARPEIGRQAIPDVAPSSDRQRHGGSPRTPPR